ncbi:hypothetical protein [Methyloglobulus sp.]|uniref:hypothetical protein n=1 Tax=Methyloglobulus sp. TaxID=2518622 RepID=UPI00398A1533
MKAVLLGLLLFVGSANAKVFQFLYIEASEGNSSGGHVAVQLGDDVYHYQYENALIRLFKHHAGAFQVNYQLLQNRSLHIADIEVSDSAYDRISSYFKVRFFGQTQRLKHLRALQHDQSLLRALLQWKAGKPVTSSAAPELSPHLPGAGLFYSDGNWGAAKKTVAECDTTLSSAKIIAEVRQQLETQYGKKFLSEKIIYLNKAIDQLSPADISDASHYSFSERYSDLLNGLLALQVLQRYQPLTDRACFEADLLEMRLNGEEIKQAKDYQQAQLHTVQSLMVSKRPDWGYALFVTLARLIVIEQSIKARHWTFLDDTNENAIAIPKQQLALYDGHMQKQRRGDLMRLHEAVSDLGGSSGSYERRYVTLEMAANRYQQWLESDKTGALRYQSEQPLPEKSIPSTRFLLTDLPAGQLEIALHHQEMDAERLITEDSDRNAYHLLTKNCVTALFELINQAVSGQSEQMLGGFIGPKINFIPFQAFDSVQEAYNVVNIRELPAYRQQELTKMYNREVDSWVFARESNVFSSSLYDHNPDDAWFVFFTDDTILLRPLFGAVNTLAATSQSVLGLIRWPFDEGKEIKIGVRGVLASLPELAFFNIRKGSYPYSLR